MGRWAGSPVQIILLCTGWVYNQVSVEEADNDPKVLLTYVEPIDAGIRRARLPGELGARLGRAEIRIGVLVDDLTVALVLDDVHLLHNSECRAALSRPAAGSLASGPGLYRFRTRRRCCELQFGRMSRMGQDRGSCLFACSA
jgi:hypothetical protein